ncbi:MAG TPA: L,D-transpeptidase family protein [Tenuifilaceae bacterium]|jgi:lipoprotein-anchoring transpeptidase ErfK/SrfK|nr:L,D-transpeptidase family protein [Bacteroidales bacterium]MDI9517349.1 L,D-transpeptidase family protein [Bacteroidota bacterium]OQC61368.1 MAG: murein L,D-transpeptidase [Bacteroidetes bacterium ADurb.Bin008]HNV80314.1 L,D-transpeptidase family protein [Tenuifilaceae bacterium]MZP81934.1 L,D-transpeptidase family protein [Bacteroidales bacterium]
MIADDTILEFDFGQKRSKKRVWSTILVLIIPLLFIILFSSYQQPDEDIVSFQITYSPIDFQCDLQSRLYSMAWDEHLGTCDDPESTINNLVKLFFEHRDFVPVWTTIYDTNKQFKGLMSLIDSAKYLGFPLDYFDAKSIKSICNTFTETKSLESRVNLELAATFSAFKLMAFLKSGILGVSLSPRQADFMATLPALLDNAISQDDIRGTMLGLQPDMVQFNRIVNSLPHFIDLHLSIQFTTPKFIDDRMLARGLYYAGITNTAEIDSNETNAPAIAKLQRMYNLPIDSVLNKPTHHILVSLLQYRYYQACLNLNRLRNLDNNDENFLFVNIPEYKLHVIESKQEKEVFNVIVGKTETPTPIFSSNLETVITNPHWTVPKSIVNEMLPKIRRDSAYLQKNGYVVIDGREQVVDMSSIDWSLSDPLGTRYFLRQMNSSSNALGLVKFIFPNEYNVYIHDTPSRGLFRNTTRTYSHGCIRLENPDKLAQYLTDRYIDDESWNIKKLISSKESKTINLKQKLGVHIQYITCSGNDGYGMEFYKDIYNLDRDEMATVFPNQPEI